MFQLPIENDEELLKKYGLASALLASTDYLLGEMVRLNGGLFKANQDLVNALLDKKTFGFKVGLAKHLIEDKELIEKFKKAVEDRNILAHGVSVEQNGEFKLMSSNAFHDLNTQTLDEIIARTRELSGSIYAEIKKNFNIAQ
ncbi:MAG: hypothetical protein V4469_05160 [Patescibacteria group bacterium]